jgi:hypothetical protein
MIDPTDVRALKDQIVEVIQSRIPLTRVGANWIGKCPWHADRHPSLEISVRKRLWRCWPCGMGGDAIDFIQKFHGVSFGEALKLLGAQSDVSNFKAALKVSTLQTIDKDADALLVALKAREDKTMVISRSVVRKIAATPPLMIPARWYLCGQICDQTFDEIEQERDRIERARRRHKEGVLTCKA